MSKKPTLPTGLSPRARRLWRSVVNQYELAAAEVELLRLACVALDRADDAAAVITAEGAYLPDRFGGSKQHPAVDVEVRSRSAFAQIVKQLNVVLDEVPVSSRRGAKPGPKARPARLRRA